MEVKYNVCGPRRKEMVQAVSEALGGWSKRYLGVPSCSYQVETSRSPETAPWFLRTVRMPDGGAGSRSPGKGGLCM